LFAHVQTLRVSTGDEAGTSGTGGGRTPRKHHKAGKSSSDADFAALMQKVMDRQDAGTAERAAAMTEALRGRGAPTSSDRVCKDPIKSALVTTMDAKFAVMDAERFKQYEPLAQNLLNAFMQPEEEGETEVVATMIRRHEAKVRERRRQQQHQPPPPPQHQQPPPPQHQQQPPPQQPPPQHFQDYQEAGAHQVTPPNPPDQYYTGYRAATYRRHDPDRE
jgi:hypothetical protein